MTFWPSGKFSISGEPHEGRYQIDGAHLQLAIKRGDRTLRTARDFELRREAKIVAKPIKEIEQAFAVSAARRKSSCCALSSLS